MKLVTISLAGQERTLCFSSRVIVACADRYGSVDAIGDALDTKDVAKVLKETAWLLSQMMEAGFKYLTSTGATPQPAMTEEEILDLTGPDDIGALKASIFDTVVNTGAASVEVDGKNGAATPGKSSQSG